MNWQYLLYFKAVAEEQHYTRAAEKLFVSVSALSRAIGCLEAELHVKLFAKSGRNVTLTKYGVVFLQYVLQATHAIDEGCKALDELSSNLSGTISISAFYTFSAVTLPNILRRFTSEYPEVSFNIYQDSSQKVMQDVLDNRVEVGFISDYFDEKNFPSLEFTPIMTEKIVLIVPPSHPLAARKSVSIAEIAGEQFIGFDHNSNLSLHLDRIFKEEGYHYQIKMMLSDDYAIAGMVRTGMGIALIPSGRPVISREGLCEIQLEGSLGRRTIYATWKKDNFTSHAVTQFQNSLRSMRMP